MKTIRVLTREEAEREITRFVIGNRGDILSANYLNNIALSSLSGDVFAFFGPETPEEERETLFDIYNLLGAPVSFYEGLFRVQTDNGDRPYSSSIFALCIEREGEKGIIFTAINDEFLVYLRS